MIGATEAFDVVELDLEEERAFAFSKSSAHLLDHLLTLRLIPLVAIHGLA